MLMRQTDHQFVEASLQMVGEWVITVYLGRHAELEKLTWFLAKTFIKEDMFIFKIHI